MSDRHHRIMLVEPDAGLIEMLVSSLLRRFGAQIICAGDSVSALDAELTDPQDLVIVEQNLPGDDGLKLTEQLCSMSRRPVILLCDEPDADDLIRAVRTGVCDAFRKPFSMEELLDSAQRALYGFEIKRQSAVKYRRMREMVRRVIRERRDLNRRIDLVCRDLVESHRRLAYKFIEHQKMQAGTPTV